LEMEKLMRKADRGRGKGEERNVLMGRVGRRRGQKGEGKGKEE
jgi:hypothetical protein